MSIDHKRFVRVLSRCKEVGTQTGVPKVVALVFVDTLDKPIARYLTADAALTTSEVQVAKEGREASEALKAFDQAYRVARSTVLAYLPDMIVPATLRSLSTDTDRMLAIENLLEIVETQTNQPWATALISGEFGKEAAKVVAEVSQAIEASKTATTARDARAEAYGVAYERYLAFKRVVRDACGPASKEYQRINLRSTGPGEPEPEQPVVPPTPTDPTGPTS